ncbi:UDP-glucose 4-epimerase [Bacillus sp. SORGH_AS 510]|nr:UDP-glucose 4-epimerase [Bacillus sp. SORGH_AS_0510]
MVMAVLVTGGAGYIGSHTCVELLNSGYEIIILDNFSNSKPESLQRISQITGKDFSFYELDLLDAMGLRSLFANHSIEAVIHFAGLKAVGESVHMPLYYYQTNIMGTLNLCTVMKEFGVHKLVFSSSATVYGVPERVPISEDCKLNATNPYGRTKLILEELFRDLYNSDDRWSIALLRYFNPIGAHESGLIGEDPNGFPNNLMPIITQVAMGTMKELLVFGSDYATVDGTGVRDYIHVIDLANGHLKALEKVMFSVGIEAYNLGTGTGYSVLELIAAFERETGVKIPYRMSDRRPGDIAICYADPSKAKYELDWRATRRIEDMCRDSWKWQKKNPEGYQSGVSPSLL